MSSYPRRKLSEIASVSGDAGPKPNGDFDETFEDEVSDENILSSVWIAQRQRV